VIGSEAGSVSVAGIVRPRLDVDIRTVPHLSQTFFLRFAPAVLATLLLLAAVSDASASCLAAWLCPPPAARDCGQGHNAALSLESQSDSCGFEAAVDRASQKLTGTFRLEIFDVALPFFARNAEAAASPVAVFYSLGLSPPGPPHALYTLQAALLI